MRPRLALAALVAAASLTACRRSPAEVAVKVGANGFDPWRIPARAGQPLVLVLTRTTDDTCAKEIVIPDAGVNTPLPLGKPVRVELVPGKAGTLRFSCAMRMFQGEIEVE